MTTERLARFEPVTFDSGIVELIEEAATARGLTSRRMTSGAGHDAQMIARVAPSAMIFVPSIGGISHNPKEFTPAPIWLLERISCSMLCGSLPSDANNYAL